MRIDFIDLDKQINQNKRGCTNNERGKKGLEKPKQATPHMNNKLNNKQITLYITFGFVSRSPHSHMAITVVIKSRIKIFLTVYNFAYGNVNVVSIHLVSKKSAFSFSHHTNNTLTPTLSRM